KTVISFDPAAVQTIEVKEKRNDFSLKRAAGGKWSVIEGSQTSEGEPTAIERLLGQLHDLKAMSMIADPMPSPQPFGMDNPVIQYKLLDKSGKQIGSVALASVTVKKSEPVLPSETAPRTEYYASSSASKAVYSLSEYTFSELN